MHLNLKLTNTNRHNLEGESLLLLVDMHANRDHQKPNKEKCGQTRPKFKQVKRLHCYTVMYQK